MVVILEKSVAFVIKIAKISVGRGTKSHGCDGSSNEWRRGGRKERWHVDPTEVTTKIADVVPPCENHSDVVPCMKKTTSKSSKRRKSNGFDSLWVSNI
jgi:hypothetical protein